MVMLPASLLAAPLLGPAAHPTSAVGPTGSSGSTAALSAALSAAEADAALAVCLTEPAFADPLAFNPAIDFGKVPKEPGREWRSMVAAVSDASLPHLRVLLRTTVRGAVRNTTDGRVIGLKLVTRTPKAAAGAEWGARLSDTLADWYSPAESPLFTKNWGHGNDMAAACLYLPSALANASVAAGEWAGGVNVTALKMAEDRAYGWFHAMAAGAQVDPTRPGPPAERLVLNRTYSGTGNGLVKFPYIRDTRRAVGLNGFRLNHTMMMSSAVKGHPSTGVVFDDRVGLGDYNFDVKPGEGYGSSNGGPRRLPDYMWNFTTNTGLSGHAAPFYFPFRALTVAGAPNVVVAGKTIAMTFAANTAAREHADEWSCGQLLRTPQIAQPLSWAPPTQLRDV
eukprot:gene28493-33668_t